MSTYDSQPIHVVCFGGGTGLSTLLAGMRTYASLRATAIVSVFDNGGSSGILHDRFGILPPGDILKCILALSPNESHARTILLHRIETNSPGIHHTTGNILLMGLEQVYGSYTTALEVLSRALSVHGRAIPASLSPATLVAQFHDGESAFGEVTVDSKMQKGKEITRLYLDPGVEASDAARSALAEADVVCIGPGSFYTSILPTLLPQGIKETFMSSAVPVIYIANLVTEGTGMNGLHINEAVKRIEDHIGRSVTAVIANNTPPADAVTEHYAREGKRLLLPTEAERRDARYVCAPLWNPKSAIAHHDAPHAAALVEALAHHILTHKSAVSFSKRTNRHHL